MTEGIIPGLSYAEYCDMEALNASTFLRLAHGTPAEAHYEMTHPKDDTPSLVKGHATHAAVLEPAVFDALYVRKPRFGDLRTKAAKESRDTWEAENRNKALLEPDEWVATTGMRDRLLASPFLREFLVGSGQNELTLTWTDTGTKLKCKARLDRITVAHGYQTLVDLKTAEDTSDHGIERAMAKYDYHIRMAWYIDALNLVRPTEWRVVFVWACSQDPYVVRATEMDDAVLDQGRAAYRTLVDLYAECAASGRWPGHPDGVEVVNPAPWAYGYKPKGTW